MITGKTILPAAAFEYLGVTLTVHGTTDTSILRRAATASGALSTLKALRLLVRGMQTKQALYVYDTFVVSRWTYASFLQPYTPALAHRLGSIDAGFLSATLIACRAKGTGKRRSTLPILRALSRLPSPSHRRKSQAHRYVRRLHRLIADDEAPTKARDRAKAALAALPTIPGFNALVPDLDDPWDAETEKAEMVEEWRGATQASRRPVPPPAPGPGYLLPALRLKEKWAVALAARYHCSTFPILHRQLPRQGPRNHSSNRPRPLYDKAVTSHEENAALATLALLQRPTCTSADLRHITAALHVLRPRERWAHRPTTTLTQ